MSEERTELPTAKKLREARKRGQVAVSRDFVTAAVFLSAAGIVGSVAPSAVTAFRNVYAASMHAIETRGDLFAIMITALTQAAWVLAPVLLTLALAATLATFVQVGPLLAPAALQPSMERLNPAKSFAQLFSGKQFVELLKSIVKLAVVAWVVVGVMKAASRGVFSLIGRDALTTMSAIGTVLQTLFLRVGLSMLAIAVLDILYQRWQLMRQLRMTKDEVRREHRESEGDPHAKAERERVRREILAHSVLEAVRRADVLVVNPTHLAIALRYDDDQEDSVPEVLAKGQDELARRMIAAAQEAGVPIMRDVPLAHALYEIARGDIIPEALYEAVALVLEAAWAERRAESER